MRELIGILVSVNGLIVAGFMLREHTIEWKGFGVIAAAVIALGIFISYSPNITEVGLKGGGMSAEFKKNVEQVETRAKEVEQIAGEVRDIKDQVKLLVQNANTTNDKIKASEESVGKLVREADATKTQIDSINKQAQTAASAVKMVETNVTKMRDNVRQTWQSLLESYYYSVRTRNIFPIPQPVAIEIEKHLNILAEFAHPDPQERAQQIQRMNQAIQKVQSK